MAGNECSGEHTGNTAIKDHTGNLQLAPKALRDVIYRCIISSTNADAAAARPSLQEETTAYTLRRALQSPTYLSHSYITP